MREVRLGSLFVSKKSAPPLFTGGTDFFGYKAIGFTALFSYSTAYTSFHCHKDKDHYVLPFYP